MSTTGFGWQGFHLEHPSDWAPVALTGNRAEGYAQLASPSRLALQLRWKKATSGSDLPARLQQYFSKLERDAKKGRASFRSDFESEDGALIYRWQGVAQGRGTLFFSEACSRVFFLEVVAGRNDSILPVFRSLCSSFHSPAEETERWMLLGLSLRLPRGLDVERKQFHAGKTHLALSKRGVKMVAERWGLAEQLLSRHNLGQWAKAVLEMKSAVVTEEAEGLRLGCRSVLGRQEALVRHEPDLNQITVVKTATRKDEWTPKWEWLL